MRRMGAMKSLYARRLFVNRFNLAMSMIAMAAPTDEIHELICSYCVFT